MTQTSIAIISGSPRQSSASRRVADVITQMLIKRLDGEHVQLIDLAEQRLPIWDPGLSGFDDTDKQKLQSILEIMRHAGACILITPEWNGMAAPALKNLLMACGHALAHKPVLIVTVSAGMGGAYPNAELRMSAYKNSHAVFIPGNIVFRNINDLLADVAINDLQQLQKNASVYGRLNNSLEVLLEYSNALTQVRASGVINPVDYASGI